MTRDKEKYRTLITFNDSGFYTRGTRLPDVSLRRLVCLCDAAVLPRTERERSLFGSATDKTGTSGIDPHRYFRGGFRMNEKESYLFGKMHFVHAARG